MQGCVGGRGRHPKTSPSENERCSVRRPRRVPIAALPTLSIGYLLDGAAIEGHDINPVGVRTARPEECDLPPIGRPVRHGSSRRRRSKSQALATIHCAAPNGAIRHRNVGNPFTVLGEFELGPRYSTEVGKELGGFQIVTEKLTATLMTSDKQALAVDAGDRRTRGQRAVGQLERPTLRPLERCGFVAQGPHAGGSLRARLEDEVPAIQCPITAAGIRFWIPARKQWIRAVSVDSGLPKGVGDAYAGIQSKAYSAPIGRPAYTIRLSGHRCQLANLRPVDARDVQLTILCVDQLLTVRGPGCLTVLSNEVAHPPHGVTQQGRYPKLAG